MTLLKSSIRKTQILRAGEYAREDAEDDRFSDYFGSMQSIVTSSAQNDSGMFETILRDERYLPFENSGVISEWRLELSANPNKNDPSQFDVDAHQRRHRLLAAYSMATFAAPSIRRHIHLERKGSRWKTHSRPH